MKNTSKNVSNFLCALLTLSSLTYAIIYNKALSTAVGGTATATSSTPYATGYEPNWAIDGNLTFCNSATCPGPYLDKMFKSKSALTTEDVFLLINMGSI